MHFHKAISIRTFRYLCLATALANAGGNVGVLLFYQPIFKLVGAPLPKDLYSFAFVCGFSFTVGVLAFMVFLAPEKTVALLVVGIVGVSGVESICDLDAEIKHRIDVHRLSGDLVLERHAFEILHRDERLAFMLPNLVDGADIRVILAATKKHAPPGETDPVLANPSRVLREEISKLHGDLI